MIKKLNKLFKNSKRIAIDDNSKIVIMSDCHRGSGDNYDSFLKNKNIFKAALRYYYNNDFTYIELGDGDDMWEVKNYNEIVEEYLDIFKLLRKFYIKNRLIMIYGNHDIVKKSKKILKKYFYKYYDKVLEKEDDLLDEIVVYESLILDYKNCELFLLHGHQADFLNSVLWRFSRFLVRSVWRIFEQFGIKDFTASARGHQVTSKTEKKLHKWSQKANKILISGHTHRPIFPKCGQSLYFNDGSCIHPNGITSLEIINGTITLVRWELNVNEESIIYIERRVLEGSEPIINFYVN